MSLQTEYLKILLFTLIGFGFFAFLLGVIWNLVRERGSRKDLSPYECGMPPVGPAWNSPNIRFYIFCLLFVIFDVEAVFVFPWAVRFHELGMEGFLAVLLFAGFLFLGLIYAWRKDVLKWE